MRPKDRILEEKKIEARLDQLKIDPNERMNLILNAQNYYKDCPMKQEPFFCPLHIAV